MNSKNFNAAEKHFEKKRVQMQKQTDNYRVWKNELDAENKKLKSEVISLQAELNQLKEWVERLLQYTELDINDIKIACEKDKSMADTFKMLNSIGVYFGGLI